MSDSRDEYDLDELSEPYTFYSVPVAAALWCGISKGQVQAELARCVAVEDGIWRHPDFPGLEFRCRTLHDAIDVGSLRLLEKDGKRNFGRLAPDDRYLQHSELKAWMGKKYPKQRPSFLFGETKQSAQPEIAAETYQALMADLEAMKAANSEISAALTQTVNENKALRAETDSLKQELHRELNVDTRARSTYVTLIGVLIDLMFSKTSRGVPNSVFRTQSELIAVVVAQYGHLPGISKRTLEAKFGEGKSNVGPPP